MGTQGGRYRAKVSTASSGQDTDPHPAYEYNWQKPETDARLPDPGPPPRVSYGRRDSPSSNLKTARFDIPDLPSTANRSQHRASRTSGRTRSSRSALRDPDAPPNPNRPDFNIPMDENLYRENKTAPHHVQFMDQAREFNDNEAKHLRPVSDIPTTPGSRASYNDNDVSKNRDSRSRRKHRSRNDYTDEFDGHNEPPRSARARRPSRSGDDDDGYISSDDPNLDEDPSPKLRKYRRSRGDREQDDQHFDRSRRDSKRRDNYDNDPPSGSSRGRRDKKYDGLPEISSSRRDRDRKTRSSPRNHDDDGLPDPVGPPPSYRESERQYSRSRSGRSDHGSRSRRHSGRRDRDRDCDREGDRDRARARDGNRDRSRRERDRDGVDKGSHRSSRRRTDIRDDESQDEQEEVPPGKAQKLADKLRGKKIKIGSRQVDVAKYANTIAQKMSENRHLAGPFLAVIGETARRRGRDSYYMGDSYDYARYGGGMGMGGPLGALGALGALAGSGAFGGGGGGEGLAGLAGLARMASAFMR